MTDHQTKLAELRAAYKQATRGPWKVCPMKMYIFGGDGHMVLQIRGFGAEKSGQRRDGDQDRNIDLVGAMHAALGPDGCVTAMERENARLRDGLRLANQTNSAQSDEIEQLRARVQELELKYEMWVTE